MDLLNKQTMPVRHPLSRESEKQNFSRTFGKLLVEVRDCKHMHYLMENVLKPFLRYETAAVFVLDHHRSVLQNISCCDDKPSAQYPFKSSISLSAVSADELINTVEASPFLYSPEKLEEKQIMLFKLYSSTELLGNCLFSFPPGYELREEDRDMLTELIDHLSVAVDKISALHQTKVLCEEREIMHSIHTDIVFNKDRNTFLSAIRPKIQRLFNFSHQFVAGINDDQLTVTAILQDDDSLLRFHPRYKEIVDARLPISDQVFNKAFLSNDPVVFDLDRLGSRRTLPPYILMNIEMGVKKMVMVNLRVGSRTIGIWVICLMENQELTLRQLDLVKEVSYQLSIAVENIRASEQLQKKDEEKRFLSQVGLESLGVRERTDLQRLLNVSLKSYLGFESAELMLQHKEGSLSRLIPCLEEESQPGSAGNEQTRLQLFDIAEFPAGHHVLVYDLENPEIQEGTEFFAEDIQNGISQKICIRLTNYNAVIGFVFFNFLEAGDPSEDLLSLYADLSYQLSVALSHVLSNEQINSSQQESAILASLTELIATAKDAEELVDLLNTNLKSLPGLSQLIIALSPHVEIPDPGSAIAAINEQSILEMMNSTNPMIKVLAHQTSAVLSNMKADREIEGLKLDLQQADLYRQQTEVEKIAVVQQAEENNDDYTEIVGESEEVKDVFRLVSRVSASDSTVLILGETGTGKELIARAIHHNSPRRNRPLIKVNCAALPANLIESELFGHEKGSFTGAIERRQGKFELANKGTLFLDEIGEMPIDLQVKLLRALQEKEIERIGGKETIKVDVRIVAATNRNLEKEVAEGRFRSDLFYRLNIFPVSLPPLRERKKDIEPLALHFIRKFNKNCGKDIQSISVKAMEQLLGYHWPGNIRELEHLIERSVLMTKGSVLSGVLLPAPLEQVAAKAQLESFTLRTIDENEKDHILKVLKYCKGRIAGNGGAAQILGVPPTTLNSKIKRLGIKREHTSQGA